MSRPWTTRTVTTRHNVKMWEIPLLIHVAISLPVLSLAGIGSSIQGRVTEDPSLGIQGRVTADIQGQAYPVPGVPESPVISPEAVVKVFGVDLYIQKINVIEGEPLNLTCQAGQTTNIRWERNGNPDNTYGSTLFISVMLRSDAGIIRCSVPGHEEKPINVSVLYPPSTPTIHGPIAVQLSSTANFTCSTDANPPASFSWINQYFDPEYLPIQAQHVTGRGAHHSAKVQHEDDIWTYCYASNVMVPTVGEPVTSFQWNRIKSKVIKFAKIVSLPATYRAVRGSLVDITCMATFEPAGEVYWTRNNDDGFRVKGSRLLIADVTKDHTDIYVCNAENEASKPWATVDFKEIDRKPVQVTIIDPPVRWECYRWSKLERRLLGTGAVRSLDGVSPQRRLCENHPGYLFSKRHRMIPQGCRYCICCRPVTCGCNGQRARRATYGSKATSGSTTTSGDVAADTAESCDSNAVVTAAAVVAWIVAVLVLAGIVVLYIRNRCRATATQVGERSPVPKTHREPQVVWAAVTGDERPALPHRPVKKAQSKHTYMELDPAESSTIDAGSKLKRNFDEIETPSAPPIVHAASQLPTGQQEDYLQPQSKVDYLRPQAQKPDYLSLEATHDYVNVLESDDYLSPTETDGYLSPTDTDGYSSPTEVENYLSPTETDRTTAPGND